MFKNIIGHLKTVLTHKWYVFVLMAKSGYIWRGITHDLSKFSPVEFCESVKYYTGTISPIVKCKEANGYSLAWQHHKGRNPHHYEYWVDYLDDGGKPIKIPYKYVIELVCDYIAACKAYNKSKFTYKGEYEWLKNKFNVEHPKIHEETKEFIVRCMDWFAADEKFDPKAFRHIQIMMNY